MKYHVIFFILLLHFSGNAQTDLPLFLEGTWKIENKDLFEHWDLLNEHSLMGFSYGLQEGEVKVSEYLSLDKKGNEIYYTATVLGQNRGQGIPFKLIRSDSVYLFENPDHDFPKQIVYQKMSETEVWVSVSDGDEKGFTYKMTKPISSSSSKDSTSNNPNYDRQLAEKLGGDSYGMKAYTLVVLKTGSNSTTDQSIISQAFRGHMENINRLVDQGTLIVAGPLGKNENNYRGIFILQNIETTEEARELLQTDPAIKDGLLDFDLYNWYGSAALPEYLEVADKIWKVKP